MRRLAPQPSKGEDKLERVELEESCGIDASWQGGGADKEDKSGGQRVCPCTLGEVAVEEETLHTSDKHRKEVEHSQLDKDNDDADMGDHGNHFHRKVGLQFVAWLVLPLRLQFFQLN